MADTERLAAPEQSIIDHGGGDGGGGSGSGGGFFAHFSSKWSRFVGRNSDDGVYHQENNNLEEPHRDSSATVAASTANIREISHRRSSRRKSHRSSATSSWSWSWRRRFSRPSIGGVIAKKLTSASTISTHSSSAMPCSSPGPASGANQQHLHAPGSLLRERVIEPKKVPDFLIPALSASEKQRLIGGSWNNLRPNSSMTSNNSNAVSTNNFASGNSATGFFRNKNQLVLDINSNVASSSSFYGGLPTSGSINNELSSEKDRQMARAGDNKSSFWRRGSIPSSLDNLIYGTLQTNELIKRSSTELINDLVQIIAPEQSGRRAQAALLGGGGVDAFGMPSPKSGRLETGGNTLNGGDLLKMAAETGNSSNSVAGRTSGQWDCYQRCIASVRFQLVERHKHCVLSAFIRRLHNSPISATFYSTLKSSVMQWKISLFVVNKSCKVLVKKKHCINGPMPLDELELFSGIRLPRLSKLVNHSCNIWLRLQLSHRPIDDDDYDDEQDESGLWQRSSHRRSTRAAASRRAATRVQRFPPFLVFLSNILPVASNEWCSDVECPSVKLVRREKQQQQVPAQQKPGENPCHSRSFAAFPCSCSSAAAFDRTLLSSKNDRRNMVIALLSFNCYVFASPSSDSNEPRNIVLDFKEICWRKPGLILTKFLDFWLFAKTTLSDGREEKSKTGMTTSRIWAKSDLTWRVRSMSKRGTVKSLIIRLSGRTINNSHVIASIELSETSEDYMAAQLFHTIFRHVYLDEHYNRPAETLSKPVLSLAGDGDESNPSIRKCFSIDTVLPLIAVP